MTGTYSKGLNRGDGLVDARGVLIESGDTAIYGFGVSRSVAMAEGIIRDDGHGRVSTTPSGRVWVTIVRRSYGGGEDERVHVAPDRLVVLKPIDGPGTTPALPGSPLPTQDEFNLAQTNKRITSVRADIAHLEAGGRAPDHWKSSEYSRQNLRNQGLDPDDDDALRAYALNKERAWLVEYTDRRDKIAERLGGNDL
jgi:hypothetical protein